MRSSWVLVAGHLLNPSNRYMVFHHFVLVLCHFESNFQASLIKDEPAGHALQLQVSFRSLNNSEAQRVFMALSETTFMKTRFLCNCFPSVKPSTLSQAPGKLQKSLAVITVPIPLPAARLLGCINVQYLQIKIRNANQEGRHVLVCYDICTFTRERTREKVIPIPNHQLTIIEAPSPPLPALLRRTFQYPPHSYPWGQTPSDSSPPGHRPASRRSCSAQVWFWDAPTA